MLSSARSAPRPLRPLPRLLTLAALAGAAVVLSGCTPAVEVSAAPDSTDPACAPMMVALPDLLADAPLRPTTTQATAAWGDPSLVILRCGVTVPGPTTDRCVGVNGVDWVIRQDASTWTLTTYGRTPATEIVLDPDKIASSTVLAQLSSAVLRIPSTKACLGAADETAVPTK
ncbi:DUF3515 domain-containing protein [Arthrobacter sp. A5]|uniref:DUF3515 domain-containing protein n=1 Tax=Arthrobacter sp. A5 TaxID=576926 RepID=UPI003DA928BC